MTLTVVIELVDSGLSVDQMSGLSFWSAFCGLCAYRQSIFVVAQKLTRIHDWRLVGSFVSSFVKRRLAS